MLLEWDEAKRLSNLEDHGVDFKDALKRMTLDSGAAFTTVLLNVVASYLYSWLTR